MRMNNIFTILIPALIAVESAGNPNAVGDNGLAVGVLQIHKCVVDDVNRIMGKEQFTYSDRRDPEKSVLMCKIYLSHYGKGKTIEQLARIWNGGPRGDKKASTKKYWLGVKEFIEKAKLYGYDKESPIIFGE